MPLNLTEVTQILNFIKNSSKKLLLITGNNPDEISVALIELLRLKSLTPIHCDLTKASNVEIILSVSSSQPSRVLIFTGLAETSGLENIYEKYNLTRFHEKVIICYPKKLLHPQLDAAVYFAPRLGNRIKKNLFSRLDISSQDVSVKLVDMVEQQERKTETQAYLKFKNDFHQHYLNQRLMTGETIMMRMLADRVSADGNFKALLFDLIFASRIDTTMKIAAANSITILNTAKVAFSGIDFSGVHIPHANLKNMIGHRVNFSNADLSYSDLQNAYLAESNFTGAVLEGVQFGEKFSLIWPNGSAMCACFTPDGRSVIVGGEPNSIIIYDIRTGKVEYTLWEHTERVTSIQIDFEGKCLLSQSRHEIILWNLSEKTFRNLGLMQAAAFVPNKHQIVFIEKSYLNEEQVFEIVDYFSSFLDQYSKLFADYEKVMINSQNKPNIPTLENRRSLTNLDGYVSNIKISNNGQYVIFERRSRIRRAKLLHAKVAASSLNNQIELYDLQTMKSIRNFSGYSYAFSNETEFLAITRINSLNEVDIDIFNLNTLELTWTFNSIYSAETETLEIRHSGHGIRDMKFLPIAKNMLVTADIGGNIMLLNILGNSPTPDLTLRAQHGVISSIAFAHDGKTMLTVRGMSTIDSPSSRHSIRLWDVDHLLNVINSGRTEYQAYTHFVYSFKNRELICSANNRIFRFSNKGEYLGSLAVFTDGMADENLIRTLIIAPLAEQERLYVVGGAKVTCFLLSTGKILFDSSFDHHLQVVSPNGRLAITKNGSKLLVIRTETKEIISEIDNQDHAFSMDFSHDSDNRFIALNHQEFFTVVNTLSGKVVFSARESEKNSHIYLGEGTLRFSPKDHQLLASYYYSDKATQIKLWNVDQKKLITQFKGHNDVATQLCFSPSGQYLISASDSEVIVIDVQANKEIYKFRFGEVALAGTDEASSLSIHSITFFDDNTFATCQYNHSVKVWHLDENENTFKIKLIWHLPVELILCQANFSGIHGDIHVPYLKQRGAYVADVTDSLAKQLEAGQTNVVIEIIQKASVDFLEMYRFQGETLLHLIVEYNDAAAAKALLCRTKKLIEIENKHGVMPLVQALHAGIRCCKILIMMLEIFRYPKDIRRLVTILKQNGCNPNMHPWFFEYLKNSIALLEAVSEGSLNKAKMLVTQGASLTFRETNYGCNALIIAGGQGHLDIVQWLIEQGAPIDDCNVNGATVIHAAAQTGQTHVVKWLLENSYCQFNDENDHKLIPLQIALHEKKFDCALEIINYATKDLKNWELSIKAQGFYLFFLAKKQNIDTLNTFNRIVTISVAVYAVAMDLVEKSADRFALNCLRMFEDQLIDDGFYDVYETVHHRDGKSISYDSDDELDEDNPQSVQQFQNKANQSHGSNNTHRFFKSDKSPLLPKKTTDNDEQKCCCSLL